MEQVVAPKTPFNPSWKNWLFKNEPGCLDSATYLSENAIKAKKLRIVFMPYKVGLIR